MELHLSLTSLFESGGWMKEPEDVKGVDIWFPDDPNYTGYGIMVYTDNHHADYKWRNEQAVHELFNYEFNSQQRATIMLNALNDERED